MERDLLRGGGGRRLRWRRFLGAASQSLPLKNYSISSKLGFFNQMKSKQALEIQRLRETQDVGSENYAGRAVPPVFLGRAVRAASFRRRDKREDESKGDI